MILCGKFYAEKKQLSTLLKIVNRYKPLKRTHLLIIFRTTIVGIRQSYRYHCIPWANFWNTIFVYLSICLFFCLFVCLSKDGRVCEKANQHEAESMIFFSETPTTELMETPSTEILGNIRSFWKYQCSTNFISKKGIELSTFRSFKSHSNKHRLLAFKKSVLYPLRLFV